MLSVVGVGQISTLCGLHRTVGVGWSRRLCFTTKSPLSAPSTIAKSPISQPNNESKLHYKTKEHLANQLSQVNSLSIRKTCNTVSNPEAPAVMPYWTCTNSIVELNWVKGWNVAQMEYSKRGVGRFDLALLRRTSPTTDSALVGVVEVLVSSPMTDSKLQQLQNRNVPWIEVQAHVDFFRDEAKLIRSKHGSRGSSVATTRPWTRTEPLPVIGTSDGPWTCEVCKEMAQMKPDSLSFSHLAGIVDVYCSASTRKGQGQLRRKVFGIYEQFKPKIWSEPERGEEKRWFLVVGTSLSTTNWLGIDTLPMESKLLMSTHSMNPRPNAPPMEVFQEEMEKELQRERRKDAGALLDVRLEWPGKPLKDFFKEADRMSSLVSVQGIKSIGKLQASLTRIIGFRYRFNAEEGTWVPSRNHRSQPL